MKRSRHPPQTSPSPHNILTSGPKATSGYLILLLIRNAITLTKRNGELLNNEMATHGSAQCVHHPWNYHPCCKEIQKHFLKYLKHTPKMAATSLPYDAWKIVALLQAHQKWMWRNGQQATTSSAYTKYLTHCPSASMISCTCLGILHTNLLMLLIGT